MSLLYSDNSHKKLLKASKNWDTSNSFLMIIRSILHKAFTEPERIKDYYLKINPETIIFELIKNYDRDNIKSYFKRLLKEDHELGFYPIYIIDVLKYLGVSYLDIIYTTEDDIDDYISDEDNEDDDEFEGGGSRDVYIGNAYKYFYNFYDRTKQKDVLQNINKNRINGADIEKEREEIKNKIDNNPDYLILMHKSLFKTQHNINKLASSIKNNNEELYKTLNINHYIDDDDIKNYNDTIKFNGYIYKLDSCLINNFRNTNIKNKLMQPYKEDQHAITGITCNKNRYVYNGWIRKSLDPARRIGTNSEISIDSSLKSYPCSLIEFNWDLKNSKEFCLNKKECKLDTEGITGENLCFNFTKGTRILIYVKYRKISSKSKSKSSSSLSSSSKSKEEVDYYNIDDKKLRENFYDYIDPKSMKINILKERLRLFGYYRLNQPREKLEKIYIKKYIEFYNLKKSKSPEEELKTPIIPKVEGFEWFRLILEAVLYSSNLSNMIYTKTKTKNKTKNNFKIMINYIIEKLKNRNYEDLNLFYENYKTELLLFEYGINYDVHLFNFLKSLNDYYSKKQDLSVIYIYNFLKNLGFDIYDISLISKSNKMMYNLCNYLDVANVNMNNISKSFERNLNEKGFNGSKDSKNPEILIINNMDINDNLEKIIMNKNNKLLIDINLDLKKEIEFNGNFYELEMIIGENYILREIESKIKKNSVYIYIRKDLVSDKSPIKIEEKTLISDINKEKIRKTVIEVFNIENLNIYTLTSIIKSFLRDNDIFMDELYRNQFDKYYNSKEKLQELLINILMDYYNLKDIKYKSLGVSSKSRKRSVRSF
jgi:hypothetical protein